MHTMAPSGCSYEISHLRIFVLPSPSFQLSPCFVTVPEWHEFKSQIQPKNGHARTDYFPAWQSERTNVAAVAKYMAIIAVIIRGYASALLLLWYIHSMQQ
jgi:hypothetical protein